MPTHDLRASEIERLSCKFQFKTDLPDADLLRYLKSKPDGCSARDLLLEAAHRIYDPLDLLARKEAGLIGEGEYRRKARWAILQIEAWLNYCRQELALDPVRQVNPQLLQQSTLESTAFEENGVPAVSNTSQPSQINLASTIAESEVEAVPLPIVHNPFVAAGQSGRRSQVLGGLLDSIHENDENCS